MALSNYVILLRYFVDKTKNGRAVLHKIYCPSNSTQSEIQKTKTVNHMFFVQRRKQGREEAKNVRREGGAPIPTDQSLRYFTRIFPTYIRACHNRGETPPGWNVKPGRPALNKQRMLLYLV